MGNLAFSFRCVTVFKTSSAVSGPTWVPVRGPQCFFFNSRFSGKGSETTDSSFRIRSSFSRTPDAESFSAAASPVRMFARSLPEPVWPTPESVRVYSLFLRPDLPDPHGPSGIDGQSGRSPQRSSVFSFHFPTEGHFPWARPFW